jgi:hypothetical protein
VIDVASADVVHQNVDAAQFRYRRLIFFKVAREELLRRLRDAAWFGQAECGEGLLDGRGQLGALAEGPGGAGEGAQMQALEFVA